MEACKITANRDTFGNDECRGKSENEMFLWVGYSCNGETKEDKSQVNGAKRCPKSSNIQTTKKSTTTSGLSMEVVTKFQIEMEVSTKKTTKKITPPPKIITPPPKRCPTQHGPMVSNDIPLRGGHIRITCGQPTSIHQKSCIFIHKVMAGCNPGNPIPSQMQLVSTIFLQ